MMTRWLLPLLVMLSGCTHSSSTENPIRIHLPSEPVSLDPALVEDDWAVKVICNTAQGLLGYDGAGQLKQRLASKIDVSPDRRRYTFTMREGAAWSDGKPVTAAQFVLGLKRSLDPKLGSKIANMLFAIKGAKAYYTGKGSADAVAVRDEMASS